jgi:uncharacterized repeat protein (TIGR04076 family)
MFELVVRVTKVLGQCTAQPPMAPGDSFSVRDGDIRIPEGGYICLWALQSLLPLITPKEREIAEAPDQDWMWRVHHAQCPDPKGRVIFKIERVGKVSGSAETGAPATDAPAMPAPGCAPDEDLGRWKAERVGVPAGGGEGRLRDLRVVVEEVRGRCTSGMQPGAFFLLRSGRLTIPVGRHFCLYALHAALPLLPAKQRSLRDGDWLKEDCHVICPDPAGNVVLRIEELPRQTEVQAVG